MKTTFLILTVAPLLGLALLAVPAEGQRTEDGPSQPTGRTLEIGPRVGIDYHAESMVVGGQLRFAVDPWQRLDFVPSMELTFQGGLTERQLNLDGAIYIDRARTLYVGGGAAYRNTYYLEDGVVLDERETRTGYSLFAGLHLPRGERFFETQVEFRWSFVDHFEPRIVAIGLNYAIPLSR